MKRKPLKYHCGNKECTLKLNCLRFTSIPDMHISKVIKFYQDENLECTNYLEIDTDVSCETIKSQI